VAYLRGPLSPCASPHPLWSDSLLDREQHRMWHLLSDVLFYLQLTTIHVSASVYSLALTVLVRGEAEWKEFCNYFGIIFSAV